VKFLLRHLHQSLHLRHLRLETQVHVLYTKSTPNRLKENTQPRDLLQEQLQHVADVAVERGSSAQQRNASHLPAVTSEKLKLRNGCRNAQLLTCKGWVPASITRHLE
jgi:hypothetical protein